MSIDKDQLRELIIRPTLEELDMWSPAAEDLLMGTAAQESRLGTYVKQYGAGPALGIYQMEPLTHKDIWVNYLSYREEISSKLYQMIMTETTIPDDRHLVVNLEYATAMARVQYLRVPESLPKQGDIKGYAKYWKQYYNTPLGAGTVNEFVENYHVLVL